MKSEPPESLDPDADQAALRLALARLPTQMRRAIRLVRELTGLTVVTSLSAAPANQGDGDSISPPVHPRCVSRQRRAKLGSPCAEQWRWHLRTGLRTRSRHSHVCPLGLRCTCLPIFYDKTLVGIVKLVGDSRVSDRRFMLAVRILDLSVSNVCQDLRARVLSSRVETLQAEVTTLRRVHRDAGAHPREDDLVGEAKGGSVVVRALRHIDRHYLDPGLSLTGVSRELAVNDKYLTRLFTRVVGQRMHAYVQGLRVRHAARLLLSTRQPIKTVAFESGFRSPNHFRRAFQVHVGIAPVVYRRTFASR